MRLVVVNHITLDGVIQAPGTPEEDTRHGFVHGGWAAGAGGDEAVMQAFGERIGTPDGAFLFGHRSYDGMLRGWNERGGPFRDSLNATPKYVASRSADTELEWPNSTVLSGDVPAAVAELKREDGGNLVTMGSGELIRSLLPHRLIDELLLVVHPLLLGNGEKLFGDDELELELLSAEPAGSGVVICAYGLGAGSG